MLKRVLVMVLAAGCVGADDGCSRRSHENVEAQAVSFATKRSGKPPRAVECMMKDSDGDGYVTCTIFEDDAQMYGIECAIQESNRGCKPKRDKIGR